MKKLFGIFAVMLFMSSSLSATLLEYHEIDCWAVAEAAEAAASGNEGNYSVFAAAFDACWAQ